MITWIDIAGYIASFFVAASFYSRTMIPLRILAICSNVFFIVYGSFGHLYPVLVLHVFLFPLNVIRLVQIVKLIRKVKDASGGDVSIDLLIPYMNQIKMHKGDVLFERGDRADKLYYVLSGTIRLTDLNKTVGKGTTLGEFGIFSPTKERQSSAICEEDGILGVITEDKVLQLYYQNPKFGFYIVRLVISRQINHIASENAT